ncbi:protein YgfX [Microbulbifer sp. YPW1]|uniref:protein YgfX n=1 Tax=Microbulbifer sp. YPW1 TaxID=2745199 RepID=UPI00351AAB27
MTTPVCRTDPSVRSAASGFRVRDGAAKPSRSPGERSARLACDFTPSRVLQTSLVLLAIQSCLLVGFSRLPWMFVALMIPAILAFALLEWRRLLRGVGRLSTAERRWYWQARGGARREFRFTGELTLWRWLIVINGRDLDGRRVRLVLCRDSADADDWRRLLVALRFSR